MSSARVLSYGQEAYLVDLDIQTAPDRAAQTHAAAARIRARLPGADVVVGGGVIGVTNVERSPEIEEILEASTVGAAEHVLGKTHVIRVAYDGPDLEAAARTLGMSVDEVTRRHTEREVTVEIVGFLPGFGYLGPIDPRLALPRLPSPRPRVAAGSVGIAGSFTGIYPFDSPGGWNLLGRAIDAPLFDPGRDPPILFAPGDLVRFERVSPSDVRPDERKPAFGAPTTAPACGLVVESVTPGATVQDGGRWGELSRGLPPSGPLDPEAHAAANEAVGNTRGAAAIEIPLGAISVRARGTIFVSVDGRAPVNLADGECFDVSPGERAVQYLAVRGGIDVPLALRSRSTLLVARLGGFSGRALRRGDVVPVGEPAATSSVDAMRFSGQPDAEIVDIAVDEGPHAGRFPQDAFSTLLGGIYQVSRLGDRVGQRLDGDKIPRDGRDLALPTPMVRGAIQVTTDGTPIVLGPDHPTTGGYPVLAVVRRSSWGALARRRPGQAVRFVIRAA
jgi:KipI family sensor histidine kinase inhibitor